MIYTIILILIILQIAIGVRLSRQNTLIGGLTIILGIISLFILFVGYLNELIIK